MNYNSVNVLGNGIHFNRVYRLCRCARIPTKSIFNARLGINTDQRGLRPENREIFSNPPPIRSKSSDFERQAHAFMREPPYILSGASTPMRYSACFKTLRTTSVSRSLAARTPGSSTMTLFS